MNLRSLNGPFLAVLAFGVYSSGLSAVESLKGEFDPLCGPPSPSEIHVDLTELPGGVARLTWRAEWGFRTDIVRGSLTTLVLTHGDYEMATEICLRDDVPDVDPATVDDPDLPNAGEGYWYLLRTDQYVSCPVGGGNYNSEDAGQVGYRNTEIRMSGRDCTCTYPCTSYP